MNKTMTMTESERNGFEDILAYNKRNGLKSIIFATKKYSLEEAEALYSEYREAKKSSVDQEGKIGALARKMESNLLLESIVGLKNTLKDQSESIIRMTRDMGINTHILSGDNLEHCMMAAQELGMNEMSDINYVHLNFSDAETGEIQIKRLLDIITQITHKMESSKNYSTMHGQNRKKTKIKKSSSTNNDPIIKSVGSFIQNGTDISYASRNLGITLSGTTLTFIKSSVYLKEHFQFILEFCKVVIGYELSSGQKAQIVTMFKNLERVTMAIGDGFNDINMIQTSNVGIQISDKKVGYQFGDILINNLISVSVAMKLYARKWNDNFHSFILILFRHSMATMFISMLFQNMTGASGASLFHSVFLTLSCTLLTLLGIFFIYYNERYDKKAREHIAGLYIEKNRITKKMGFENFIFYLFPMALLDGAIIFAIPWTSLAYGIKPIGSTHKLQELTLIVHQVLFINSAIQLVNFSNTKTYKIRILVIIMAIIFLGLMVTFTLLNFVEKVYFIALVSIYTSPNLIATILITFMILFITNLINWSLFWHEVFYPIHYVFSRANIPENLPNLLIYGNAKKFIDNFKAADIFASTYKKCFSVKSTVNMVISNLMLPSHKQDKAKVFNKFTLNFYSEALAKKSLIFINNKILPTLMNNLLVTSVGELLYCLTLLPLLKLPFSNLLAPYLSALVLPLFYYFSLKSKVSVNSRHFGVSFQTLVSVLGLLLASAKKVEFSVVGVLILSFLSLNYNLSFPFFLSQALINMVGFGLFYVWNGSFLKEEYWGEEGMAYAVCSILSRYLCLLAVIIINRYKTERLLKSEFVTGASIDSTIVIAKDLLSLLLPNFVLDGMHDFFEISGKQTVFDDEDTVAILFCDIADFEIVIRQNENNIITLLDTIFRKFDDLCLQHGIQKIETVGKTYMAAGGLKAVENSLSKEMKKNNSVERILCLAKDMMICIRQFDALDLKIGIHVGKPVMGVIGYHKPQFSLIGDVVNTTSRHCTTGIKGHIMISAEAWEMIENRETLLLGYRMEQINTEMKGKGKNVMVYHVYPQQKIFLSKIKKLAASVGAHRTKELNNQAEIFNQMLIKIKKIETARRIFNVVVMAHQKQAAKFSKIVNYFQDMESDQLSRPSSPSGTYRRSISPSHNRTGSIIGRDGREKTITSIKQPNEILIQNRKSVDASFMKEGGTGTQSIPGFSNLMNNPSDPIMINSSMRNIAAPLAKSANKEKVEDPFIYHIGHSEDKEEEVNFIEPVGNVGAHKVFGFQSFSA